MIKLKKWPDFHDFFKNAGEVDFSTLSWDDEMAAMDQLM